MPDTKINGKIPDKKKPVQSHWHFFILNITVNFRIGHETEYNPTNLVLKINTLQAKWATAKLKTKEGKDTTQPFDVMIVARQLIFEPVRFDNKNNQRVGSTKRYPIL